MSYILEALKKSQQERQSGKVPDLQTVHQSPPQPETSSASRWPYFLIGVLLVCLAYVLGLTRPWQSAQTPVEVAPATREVPATAPSPVPAPVAAPAPVDPPVLSEELSAAESTDLPAPVARLKPDAQSRIDVEAETVADLSAMPSLFQQAVPDMQFAGHVYSDNPAQRSVIINGRSMSEGDELMPGMMLVQITQDSVVFDYQGQLFKMLVLRDWSFN